MASRITRHYSAFFSGRRASPILAHIFSAGASPILAPIFSAGASPILAPIFSAGHSVSLSSVPGSPATILAPIFSAGHSASLSSVPGSPATILTPIFSAGHSASLSSVPGSTETPPQTPPETPPATPETPPQTPPATPQTPPQTPPATPVPTIELGPKTIELLKQILKSKGAEATEAWEGLPAYLGLIIDFFIKLRKHRVYLAITNASLCTALVSPAFYVAFVIGKMIGFIAPTKEDVEKFYMNKEWLKEKGFDSYDNAREEMMDNTGNYYLYHLWYDLYRWAADAAAHFLSDPIWIFPSGYDVLFDMVCVVCCW